MNLTARIFDKEDYNQNDEWGKKIFIDFLLKKGHKIISSKEDYNHDIISTFNDEVFYFEIEVKIGYPFNGRKSFKFDSVSFLGRKKRLHNINSFYYIIICKETNSAISCFSNDIFNDEYKTLLNIDKRNRVGMDEMYRVPKNKCKFFKVK